MIPRRIACGGYRGWLWFILRFVWQQVRLPLVTFFWHVTHSVDKSATDSFGYRETTRKQRDSFSFPWPWQQNVCCSSHLCLIHMLHCLPIPHVTIVWYKIHSESHDLSRRCLFHRGTWSLWELGLRPTFLLLSMYNEFYHCDIRLIQSSFYCCKYQYGVNVNLLCTITELLVIELVIPTRNRD